MSEKSARTSFNWAMMDEVQPGAFESNASFSRWSNQGRSSQTRVLPDEFLVIIPFVDKACAPLGAYAFEKGAPGALSAGGNGEAVGSSREAYFSSPRW